MIISKGKDGFTLTELLIVLGILAVVMTAVVLLLNPTEFVAQGRDSRRISDLKNIDTSLSLIRNSLSEVPIDNTLPNIVYISLPDTNSNQQCDEYSLPALSGWSYKCLASSTNLRKVDGTGWLPVSFSSVSTNPLTVLPIDPVNNQDYYYAYSWDSSSKATVWAKLESSKYLTSHANNAQGDGGNDDAAFETWPIAWTTGGGGGDAASLFAGGSSSIFKCLISTGCNASAQWIAVTGYTSGVEDFAVDTVNNVIYAVSNMIYRCDLATGCDSSAEWTVAYDTPNNLLRSILFDLMNRVLYAGEDTSGRIYRCDVTTGCDNGSTDWTIALTTTGSRLYEITMDPAAQVLYASDGRVLAPGGSIIWRCPTSSGCDADADWTQTFNGTGSGNNILNISYDAANRVLYAAGYTSTNGVVWRCDVAATNCDAGGDWTNPRSVGSAAFDSTSVVSGALYVGYGSSDNVERCLLTSGCDASGEFSPYSLPGTDSYVDSLRYEPITSAIYAGTGSNGIIYRCLTSSLCDVPADWASAADTTDTTINEISYKPSYELNQTPGIPQSPLADGQSSPATNVSLTPPFSAIFDDPNTSDVSYSYEIEVNTNSGFTGTVMWDSNKSPMAATNEGVRSPNINYGGSALSNNTTYYWRIRFWDSFGAMSPWSATQQFTTAVAVGGGHWSVLDEVVSDSYASYVYSFASTEQVDYYTLQNTSGSGSILGVLLHVEGDGCVSTLYFRLGADVSSAPQPGGCTNLGNSMSGILEQTVSRPGGGSWTWTDINNLQAGVGIKTGPGYPGALTNVFVQVLVTGNPIIRPDGDVSIAIDGAYDASTDLYTGHWGKVDEPLPDNAGYVYTISTTERRDVYTLTDPSLSGTTINSVIVAMYMDGCDPRPYLILGASETADNSGVGSCYSTSGSVNWAVHTSPAMSRPGGGSWLWSDLANLRVGAGVRAWAGNNNGEITSVFVRVNYDSGLYIILRPDSDITTNIESALP